MSQDSMNQSQKGECPKCKGALSGGLVATCTSCGSVWTIDSMGNAVPPLEVATVDVSMPAVEQPVYNAEEYHGMEFATEEQMAAAAANENPLAVSTQDISGEDANRNFASVEAVASGGSVFDSLNSLEPPADNEFLESSSGVSPEFAVVHDAIVFAEVGEEEPDVASMPLTEVPSVEEFPPSSGPGLDQNLDITEYANSEISQAKDGQYLFRVWITGIDSKEVRSALREEMSDGRFQWDVEEMMANIKAGRLQISNLSPVKASILINRIKRLPLQIRWEQDEITQMGVV